VSCVDSGGRGTQDSNASPLPKLATLVQDGHLTRLAVHIDATRLHGRSPFSGLEPGHLIWRAPCQAAPGDRPTHPIRHRSRSRSWHRSRTTRFRLAATLRRTGFPSARSVKEVSKIPAHSSQVISYPSRLRLAHTVYLSNGGRDRVEGELLPVDPLRVGGTGGRRVDGEPASAYRSAAGSTCGARTLNRPRRLLHSSHGAPNDGAGRWRGRARRFDRR